MRERRFFRRLRALFGRMKGAGNDDGDSNNNNNEGRPDGTAAAEPVIIHHVQHANQTQAEVDNNNANDTAIPATTIEDMQATADPQSLSPFFTTLPLEIRRKIYRAVWASYLKPRTRASSHSQSHSSSSSGSDHGMRLHIYSSGSTSTRLIHTRCRVHPDDPDTEDVSVGQAWPGAMVPGVETPMWFWEAWVLRLNWGRHWRCQAAVQRRWDPRRGVSLEGGGGGGGVGVGVGERVDVLGMWLVCRRMYLESAPSFFETTTLVFTNSLDAHNFFLQQQPPYHHCNPFLSRLRSLELSFTHSNDHLFLTRITHDDPPLPSTAHSNDTATAVMVDNDAASAYASVSAFAFGSHAPALSTAPMLAVAGSHSCFGMFCGLNSFGGDLWRVLAKGIRAAAPGLRELHVHVGGRIERAEVLDVFGTVAEDEVTSGGEEEGEASVMGVAIRDELERLERPQVWELPGKVVVVFKVAGEKRGYLQVGRKMVRMETPA